MAKKQVRIIVNPLHGIGGVGGPGTVGWMDAKEARQYEDDGYVTILPDADEPVPSSVAGQLPLESPLSPPDDDTLRQAQGGDDEEDHQIIKPENKRK